LAVSFKPVTHSHAMFSPTPEGLFFEWPLGHPDTNCWAAPARVSSPAILHGLLARKPLCFCTMPELAVGKMGSRRCESAQLKQAGHPINKLEGGTPNK